MPFPPDLIDEPRNGMTGDKMIGNPTSVTGVFHRVVGMRIGLRRAEAGLSRRELADAVGAHPESMIHWESGGAVPSAFKLLLISDALGVAPDWFLQPPQRAELQTVHSQLSAQDVTLVQQRIHDLLLRVRAQRDDIPDPAERLRYKMEKRYHHRTGLLQRPDESQVALSLDAGTGGAEEFYENIRLRPLSDVDRPAHTDVIEQPRAGTAPRTDRAAPVESPVPQAEPSLPPAPTPLEVAVEEIAAETAVRGKSVTDRAPTCLAGPTLGKRAMTGQVHIAVYRVLGLRMLRVRRLLGKSRGQVASYLNVQKRTASGWETGSTPPSAIKMACLADLAGIDPREMVSPIRADELILVGAPSLSPDVVDAHLHDWRDDMERQLLETPTPGDRARVRHLKANYRGVAYDPDKVRERGRKSRAAGRKAPPLESEAVGVAEAESGDDAERTGRQDSVIEALQRDLAAAIQRAESAERELRDTRDRLRLVEDRLTGTRTVLADVLHDIEQMAPRAPGGL